MQVRNLVSSLAFLCFFMTTKHLKNQKCIQNRQRKFRSQTSDKRDRWKSRDGKSQRRAEKKQEDEKRKGQKKDDAGAQKGRKVAKQQCRAHMPPRALDCDRTATLITLLAPNLLASFCSSPTSCTASSPQCQPSLSEMTGNHWQPLAATCSYLQPRGRQPILPNIAWKLASDLPFARPWHLAFWLLALAPASCSSCMLLPLAF